MEVEGACLRLAYACGVFVCVCFASTNRGIYVCTCMCDVWMGWMWSGVSRVVRGGGGVLVGGGGIDALCMVILSIFGDVSFGNRVVQLDKMPLVPHAR